LITCEILNTIRLLWKYLDYMRTPKYYQIGLEIPVVEIDDNPMP